MREKKQSRKKDTYTIILEKIYSDFRVVGENIELIRKDIQDHKKRFDKIDERLLNLETEVALIRHNQVTRDEFKFLETRVARLERKLK